MRDGGPDLGCGDLSEWEREQLDDAIAATRESGVSWDGNAVNSIARYAAAAGVGGMRVQQESNDNDPNPNSNSDTDSNSDGDGDGVPIEPIDRASTTGAPRAETTSRGSPPPPGGGPFCGNRRGHHETGSPSGYLERGSGLPGFLGRSLATNALARRRLGLDLVGPHRGRAATPTGEARPLAHGSLRRHDRSSQDR